MSNKTPRMEPSWLEVIGDEFEKPYMQELRRFLKQEQQAQRIFPPMKDLFNAFWLTPFNSVKVVILGQDPYHGQGQAHGLCFSVKPPLPPPPSLRNIYKELEEDLGVAQSGSGDLTPWARQGVFLLNTVLTVRAGAPLSHRGRGWERFTDRVIRELNQRKSHLVYLLWGAPAQAKASMIDSSQHLILKAPHPSPFSAARGFFGCRHFSKTDRYLKNHQQSAIDWSL